MDAVEKIMNRILNKNGPHGDRLKKLPMTKAREIIAKIIEKAPLQAESVVLMVSQYPDYFVNEGGADGTFSHVKFHGNYGRLMPEVANLGSEFGGQV